MTREYGYFEGTVARIRDLTPCMRRVTIAGSGLAGFSVSAPGQWIKLFFEDKPRGGRAMTVRSWCAETRELDVDVALHPSSGGVVGRWLAAAAPGTAVRFAGPRGTFRHQPLRRLVLFGDETALPAISAIVESLPTGTRAEAHIEVSGSEAVLEARSCAGVEWTWLVADKGAPGHRLVRHCRELAGTVGDAQAFVACEATAARKIRKLLVDGGIDAGLANVSGYWKTGAREHVDGDSDY